MSDREEPSRRQALVGFVVVAGSSALMGSGCATLPRPGRTPAQHRCEHRYCRYFRSQGGVLGRCALALRDLGGEP